MTMRCDTNKQHSAILRTDFIQPYKVFIGVQVCCTMRVCKSPILLFMI